MLRVVKVSFKYRCRSMDLKPTLLALLSVHVIVAVTPEDGATNMLTNIYRIQACFAWTEVGNEYVCAGLRGFLELHQCSWSLEHFFGSHIPILP